MLIRIVANAIKPGGGGEMSTRTTAELLVQRGHQVVWHPTTDDPWPWPTFCRIGTPYWRNRHWSCDLLFYVTNDTTIPESDRRCRRRPVDPAHWRLATSAARRSVLHINWQCIGDAVRIADQFDRFAFLSSWLRDEFVRLTAVDPSRTWVHASAVDLTPYLQCTPEYGRLLIARHSHHWKWPPDSVDMIRSIARVRRNASFRLMGLHPYQAHRLSRKVACSDIRSAGSAPPHEFLDGASLFIYPCKLDYREQGPRTVVEAMAAGLPCMVDNRDGPSDRVTRETGWLLDRHNDYPGVIARVTSAELREKGEAARERARTVFRPDDWADWLEEVAT